MLRHDETTKTLDLERARRNNAWAIGVGRRSVGPRRMTEERRDVVATEYSPAFVILVDRFIVEGNMTALQRLRSIYVAATRRRSVPGRPDLGLMSIFQTRLDLLDEAITMVSLDALKRRLTQEQLP